MVKLNFMRDTLSRASEFWHERYVPAAAVKEAEQLSKEGRSNDEWLGRGNQVLTILTWVAGARERLLVQPTTA